MSRHGLPSQEVESARTAPDPTNTPSDLAPDANTHTMPPNMTGKRQVSALQSRVIDAMYETLAGLDHRDILSVRPGADPLEIRCAYESLLAAFHPRRFERIALDEHREKLDAILRRIQEAYAALSTPAERASYDARFGKPDL